MAFQDLKVYWDLSHLAGNCKSWRISFQDSKLEPGCQSHNTNWRYNILQCHCKKGPFTVCSKYRRLLRVRQLEFFLFFWVWKAYEKSQGVEVNCQATKVGTKTSILKESLTFATSNNTCVPDIIKTWEQDPFLIHFKAWCHGLEKVYKS